MTSTCEQLADLSLELGDLLQARGYTWLDPQVGRAVAELQALALAVLEGAQAASGLVAAPQPLQPPAEPLGGSQRVQGALWGG